MIVIVVAVRPKSSESCSREIDNAKPSDVHLLIGFAPKRT
jgi:hypothetical protein